VKTCVSNCPCPCGRTSGKTKPLLYAACCGRYLESDTPAPDAESLMRSRYSAFVLEREPYLLATWHASHRPAFIAFESGVKWLGLEVRQHLPVDADNAEVEFIARQKPVSGGAVRLHERSRFVREGGRWLYLDGNLS
jgi:SEC-C motif domain protein